MGFALIPFTRLPSDEKRVRPPQLLRKGAQELAKVWRVVKQEWNVKSFLFSFFCYSAGVQTVLFLASTFAEKELRFGTSELIAIILLLQILAIGGAYFFARVSELRGNKFSLISMLLIWVCICGLAYFVESKLQFYILAGAVGSVMGGIQSLSRSTYSKLIPEGTEDTASYFSFYDILEKLAIVLGTFSFGIVEQLTGGMRNSILALTLFFIAGLLLLLRVRIQPAEEAVPNPSPIP
jgi:UMF1 family MFS transporter